MRISLKDWFTTKEPSVGGLSETTQTSSTPQDTQGGSLPDGNPIIEGYSRHANRGRSSIGGHDQAEFMASQLG